MRNVLLFLILLIGLISCREDIHVDEPPCNPYGIVFDNTTKGQIWVRSRDIVMGVPEINAGESSEAYYTAHSNVSIEYVGEGTHWDTMKKDIVLEKDKTIHVQLTWP